MRKIISGILSVFFVLLIGWVGGLDFERGILQAYFVFCSVVIGLTTAFIVENK